MLLLCAFEMWLYATFPSFDAHFCVSNAWGFFPHKCPLLYASLNFILYKDCFSCNFTSNFVLFLVYFGVTKGKWQKNISYRYPFTHLNPSPGPGFYGVKGNFTKFIIFIAFFIFLYSMMTFSLSRSVFLLFYD